MHDDETRFDDPLLDGFDGLPAGAFEEMPLSPERREAILHHTSRVIRGYRWRRRARIASAMLLVFAAGAFSGAAFLGERADAPDDTRTASIRPDRALPVTAVGPVLPRDPRDLGPRLLEAPPEERDDLLRQAGDGYLSGDRSDPLSALYCYRRLLDEAPEARETTARTDDTWLLLYLKLDRR